MQGFKPRDTKQIYRYMKIVLNQSTVLTRHFVTFNFPKRFL
jgi:hypothetical protein